MKKLTVILILIAVPFIVSCAGQARAETEFNVPVGEPTLAVELVVQETEEPLQNILDIADGKCNQVTNVINTYSDKFGYDVHGNFPLGPHKDCMEYFEDLTSWPDPDSFAESFVGSSDGALKSLVSGAIKLSYP